MEIRTNKIELQLRYYDYYLNYVYVSQYAIWICYWRSFRVSLRDIQIFTNVRPNLKIACMYIVHGVHQKKIKNQKVDSWVQPLFITAGFMIANLAISGL